MTLRLVVGATTDVGRVRDHNEDGFLVDGDLGLVAVADGMGGHRGGEVASATALSALRDVYTEGKDLRAAVVAANDAVFERSVDDDSVRGMGTTLTAGVLAEDGGTLVVGHVGDSRAYLFRNGELRRVTTDHSLVEELIQAGEITEEDREHDPRRSQVTRAIGLEPGVEVDLYPIELEPGDRIVLCSDGLNTMVRDETVSELLAREPDPEKAARLLVDAANDAGGVDNITVLVVDVVEVADDEVLEAVPVEADSTELVDSVGEDATAAGEDAPPTGEATAAGEDAPPTDEATAGADEVPADDATGDDDKQPARRRRRFWLFGRRR